MINKYKGLPLQDNPSYYKKGSSKIPHSILMKVKIFLAIWYFMKCHDTWYLKSNKLQWSLLKTVPFFFISLDKQLH